ncbi:MAG: hypothetical protein ACI4I0_05355 [Acutalibacteraceae bacterium]
MAGEYEIPNIGLRYMLECRYKKFDENGNCVVDRDGTVNPVSGFIYAENEKQAVEYGMDFIMKYAGDNLRLEDDSILLFEGDKSTDLYYDFFAVEVK